MAPEPVGIGDARVDLSDGFYSCLVCGHRVHPSRAWTLELTGGQPVRGHPDCFAGRTPRDLEVLYYAAIHDLFALRGVDALWDMIDARGLNRMAASERDA
jgi:hypothetical protein